MSTDVPSPFLTILTPSWNRAHLLPRLHRSIVKSVPAIATIEWLIVDDGSSDNTCDCVADFGESEDLAVRYLKIDRGGKHRALNAGFAAASGDWVIIVDSDDWFLTGGLERALQEIREAAALGADALFLPMEDADRESQHTFEEPNRCVSFLERVNQESWFDTSFVFSNRICQFRFPEFSGENYLAPGAFLYDLDPGYRFYLSDQVCVAIQYQMDGLSRQNLWARLSSPVGNTFTYSRLLNMHLHPALRLRALVNYGRFWWHCIIQSKKPVRCTSALQIAILPFTLPFTLFDLWFSQRYRDRCNALW